MVGTRLSPESDAAAVLLERHAVRRSDGIATVSVLVGPPGAGGSLWRRWAAATGRQVVVAAGGCFPLGDWLRRLAERVDLPAAALDGAARLAGREVEAFRAEWRSLTDADRQARWNALPIHPDDVVFRRLVGLAEERSRGAFVDCAEGSPLASGAAKPESVAAGLLDLGAAAAAAAAVRLAPADAVPAVLWNVASIQELATVALEAARWAMEVPSAPMAVAAPDAAWKEYLASTPNTRAKAVLREGVLEIPLLDSAAAVRALLEAGASPQGAAAVGAVVGDGADPSLVEAAVEAARALDAPADGARSAAERLLHQLLESIPETAGLFELNGILDFRFGRKWAEVDLLCRSRRIAVELDGYHHFREAVDYRRDRNKDWELQRRGFLVLRFLAEDVLPELETIRDRILSAVAGEPPGASK